MRCLHRRCSHLAQQNTSYDPRGPFCFHRLSPSGTISLHPHFEYVDDFVLMLAHPRASQLLSLFVAASGQ
eukprot:10512855-Prorocentrum_lima.AAC.1